MNEKLKERFLKECRVDLSDTETVGKFPYRNKEGKWSYIDRGQGWQMYAKWLEEYANQCPPVLTDDNIKDKATAFADWLSDNGYWKHCDEEEWYYQLDKGEVKLDELWDRYLSEKMAEKVIQMKKPIRRKEEG